MKKLLTALALTLSTAVAAQQANEDMKQDTTTQAQDEQKRNEGRRIRTGVDATEVAPGMRDVAGIDTAKEGTFKKDKAFSLNGTLKGAMLGGITIARQGLPDANLDVRKETQVMLDGKKVELKAIPEGAQVRAQFQLEGEETVAVAITATSPKGTKKDMKKDMKQDMKDMKQDMKQDMNTQPDTQQ
jgi:hypothetical protein